MVVLCQVHGSHQLHLPQAQDAKPNDVIIVDTSHQHAYHCDIECVEYAEALIESKVLAVDLGRLAKEITNPKHHAGNFKPAEEVKLMLLEPNAPNSKALRCNASLNPKKEAVLVDFLCVNTHMFVWNPSDMLGIRREVTEHSMDIQAGSKPMKQRLH